MNLLKSIAAFLDILVNIVIAIVGIISGAFLSIWLIGIIVGGFICYFRKR